jgi:hypothetical protein
MTTYQQIKKAIVATLAISIMFIYGCSKNTPFEPNEAPKTVVVDGQTVRFLQLFPTDENSLNKVTSVSQYINKSTGGSIHLHHIPDASSKFKTEVVIDLKISANTIDYSKTVSMTVNDLLGQSAVEFGPHGTVYSSPAMLTIECKNVDFTGINPANLKLYYVNPNGQWTVHPAHEIYVDKTWKIIRVVNAQIPHFSKYAIGDAAANY